MVAVPALPDLSTLDIDAMRSLLLAHHERLLASDGEIEHLKLVISKLRRMIFGTKSERVTREIEQLELMRHANFQTTMNVYTRAVTATKREAQSRVVDVLMGRSGGALAGREAAGT